MAEIYRKSIYFAIAFLVSMPLMVTMWLLIFNSGSVKADEYAIEFTRTSVSLYNLHQATVILWKDVEGYKLSGYFSKQLHILGRPENISVELEVF